MAQAAFLSAGAAALRPAGGRSCCERRSARAKRRKPVRLSAAETPPSTEGRDWQKHEDDEKICARADDEGDEVPLELIDGVLDNARIRPKIDLDANEYMLMWKLRRMLHEDDFNKIFDKKDRRIGDF